MIFKSGKFLFGELLLTNVPLLQGLYLLLELKYLNLQLLRLFFIKSLSSLRLRNFRCLTCTICPIVYNHVIVHILWCEVLSFKLTLRIKLVCLLYCTRLVAVMRRKVWLLVGYAFDLCRHHINLGL